jgi:hypothetical protein
MKQVTLDIGVGWASTTPVQFWVGWQFLRGFGAVRLISPSNDGLYIP